MGMEILLHERIISLVAEKRKVRGREKEGRAIMCSSLSFFKLFTLDSSWMQAIDYDCKGARERIQPGICFFRRVTCRDVMSSSDTGTERSRRFRPRRRRWCIWISPPQTEKKDADARIESTRRISPVLLVVDPDVGDHLAIYEACADNRFLHFLIMCILHPIFWLYACMLYTKHQIIRR